jgi:hypothetical protein
MSDIARAPAPPAEIDRLRGESLVTLQQWGDDPVAAAFTVVSRQLYGPGHPYGHTTAEVAAALTATTREDLLRFHQAAFPPHVRVDPQRRPDRGSGLRAGHRALRQLERHGYRPAVTRAPPRCGTRR